MNTEFYVGYQDRCPTFLARITRWRLIGLAILVTGLGAAFAAWQKPADPGVFEFGVLREFEGVLHERPLPMLRSVASNGSVTNFLLVGAGKHGLPGFARGHDGERVRFRGSLIQMGANVMIELNDPVSFTVTGPSSGPGMDPAGSIKEPVELTGELVDTKCYFGVMRPATGKEHRACAVRCLSGGVPPGLLVRDAEGNAVVVMMTGPSGQPLGVDPQWGARRVRATGNLVRGEGITRLEVVNLSLAPDSSLP